MFFKLSLRNMKRSLKDYTIYFMTLIFSVSLFYVANSIESQKVMLDLEGSYKSAFVLISRVMEIASVFIAVVMGFLIIYANNYLFKRRKKEFGTYMILGMEKSDISKIIYLENLIIGLVSLVIGIFAGIIASHLVSLLTANLFEVSLKEFRFVFSQSACIKTIISFGVIYIIIAIFNLRSVNKVRIINLLNAKKKNEEVKVKNNAVSLIIFLISVACIGYGYYIVLRNGISELNLSIFKATVLGAVGTFLLFMSLSKFLLKIFQGNKKFYFKDVNMFVLRQVSSKINTTFVSMAFICLMLFVSICSLSGGILINRGLSEELEDLTKHDITVYSYVGEDFIKYFKEENFDFNKYASQYHYYSTYLSDVRFLDILTEDQANSLKSYYPVANNQNVPIMKLSDFNEELSIIGKEGVSLNNNQCLIFTDISDFKKVAEEIVKSDSIIKVDNKNLEIKDEVATETFNGELMKNNMCTLVVNDDLINNFMPGNTFLNLDINESNNLTRGEVQEIIDKFKNKYKDSEFYSVTKDEIIEGSKGLGISIAYLALYLGITFIIAAGAILAIQQLSESDDNIERYNLLRKIGVDEKTINNSVFNQVGIYFLLPLIISIIHSAVGLKVAKEIVVMFCAEINMINLITISSIFIIVVYGGYFLATYFGSRNIIKVRK